MADTVIGPYTVLEKLGEGGMGEVYRARDSRLNRDVALKLLPQALASDPERIARLRREAQALAALNHPNIAQVYALEERGGQLALVMELVDGPTIADLLGARAQTSPGLPVDEAIAIARQIIDGVEAAHEGGIVHRDLKPSNVKVRGDGTVKVLDFGLAKAGDARVQSGEVAMSPSLATLTSPAMTAMGVLMGTAAYVSPEQVRGRAADKRADIWAFGCVLWEMLTGTSPFVRDSMGETLAAILKDDLPWDRPPTDVPPAVRALVRRCLERDPKQRLRDIGEARIALSAPRSVDSDRPAAARPRRLWPMIAAAAVVLAVVSAGAAWRSSTQTPVRVKRLDLPPETAGTFTLSPDGQRLAYASAGHLFVRPFDSLDPADLGPVPRDTQAIVWSPDGQTIVFSGGGAIQSIPSAGGPKFTVCRVPMSGRVLGLAWIPATSNIAFSVWRDSLYSVPASGGTPIVLAPVDRHTEVDFHSVMPLADGRLIVDSHKLASDSSGVEILDGGRRTVVSSGAKLSSVSVSGNRALFLRFDVNPGLWTAPFTHDTIDFQHESLIQADAVAYDASSNNGTAVVELPAASMHELLSVDRNGGITPLPGSPVERRAQMTLAVSPDGRRAAFLAGEPALNLFVRDLRTGRDTQLTFNRADDDTASALPWRPSWHPGSDRLLHGVGPVARQQLVMRRADAAGSAQPLTEGVYGIISADGGTLVFIKDEGGRGRVMRAALHDETIESPQPVFGGDANPAVVDIDLSRDGRLLAYAAVDENNRINVYLTDFPGAHARLLVDPGGTRPRFARAGDELFYVKGSTDAEGRPVGALMSVRIGAGSPVTLGATARLFDDRENALEVGAFDVVAGGFVIPRKMPPPPGKGERVVLIENWPALVRR